MANNNNDTNSSGMNNQSNSNSSQNNGNNSISNLISSIPDPKMRPIIEGFSLDNNLKTIK